MARTGGSVERLKRLLSIVGPGIFAIGYTIGTGSVTSMAKAGADYGLGLLWVLALSCLFSGVLMSAYGRFAAVTGETALHGIVRFLPGGRNSTNRRLRACDNAKHFKEVPLIDVVAFRA